ncbi:unnamed protein product [Thelazia callipaeda]|uniref:HTH OST-type domain-containing protein n=1 Tax=Thelazia callipaeda TaxID=103827 RepID=A0A0N5CW98_THECL|nr:unnamed protein product [Thelazia callipaeda]
MKEEVSERKIKRDDKVCKKQEISALLLGTERVVDESKMRDFSVLRISSRSFELVSLIQLNGKYLLFDKKMLTLDDLKIRVVAVIGSEKHGCTEDDLRRIYKYLYMLYLTVLSISIFTNMYGKDLCPKDYGFDNLRSFLISRKMQGEGGLIHSNGRYYATGDKNTDKMLELIRNTKTKKNQHRKRSLNIRKTLSIYTSASKGLTSAERSSLQGASRVHSLENTHGYQYKLEGTNFSVYNRSINSSFMSTSVFSQNVPNNLGTLPDFNLPSSIYHRELLSNSHSSFQNSSNRAEICKDGRTNQLVNKNGGNKYIKSIRRLVNLINQNGGQISFSQLKRDYMKRFQISLDNNELRCLFDAPLNEVQDLYTFLASRLDTYVFVSQESNGDLLLSVIDDEDYEDYNSIDEFENLGIVSSSTRTSLHRLAEDRNRRARHGEQFQNRTNSYNQASAKMEFNSKNFSLPIPFPYNINSERNGRDVVAPVRAREDLLSYKVLGEKVLSFVRTKGPIKVLDLSRIFYEEDGRQIDPRTYPEGTWEFIIQKVLSSDRFPELVLQDDTVDLRERVQKSKDMSLLLLNKQSYSLPTKPPSSTTFESSVHAAMIYDMVAQSNGSLSQKEIITALNAKGIEVNACQLTVKLLTQFKDVFSCEFLKSGVLISLVDGAQRPQETNSSSVLDKPSTIMKHVPEYCPKTVSSENQPQSVILFNVEVINESMGRMRIQASFRLDSFEPVYASFERNLYNHYRLNGQHRNYKVEEAIRGCCYVFYSANNNRVCRVQCLSDGKCGSVVPVFLVDNVCYENVAVDQLRKLVSKFAEPAFGIVAQTVPFIVLKGKENEFRENFSSIRSMLLGQKKGQIKVYVESGQSKGQFELKQMYSETHADLNIPAKFVRQNIIALLS